MRLNSTAYLFQAALIILWWLSISVSEEIYRVFAYDSVSKEAFFNLLAPDLFLLGFLSLVRAYRASRDLSLIILGAFAYAALFCVNASFTSADGAIPTLTMLFGFAFNVFLVYPFTFMRSSLSRSLPVNALKTGVQILCFWTLFLGIIPFFILWTTQEPPFLMNPGHLVLAAGLFVVFSALGLTSAYYMVSYGDGTPLPLDATNKLVIKGPYAWLRNPMAVAGVGQILAVALAFGDWVIAVYAVVGGIAWHLMVRPAEEEDLLKKFGQDYAEYRERVSCWVPTRKG